MSSTLHIMRIWVSTWVLTASLGIYAQTNHQPYLSDTLKSVIPAVVNITTLSTQQQSPEHAVMHALGSGVIIDAKHGYIVTNAHVINGSNTVVVRLHDGRKMIAKSIGVDAYSDLAVLQIPATDLIPIKISSHHVLTGETAIAIGNPFGLNESVSSGIVSAYNRHLGGKYPCPFIQTDTAINPGNSGGALVNSKGELIGINTAIISPQQVNIGIGFAIPNIVVQNISSQLIQYGNVKRGKLGIMVQNISLQLAKALKLPSNHGALITEILPGSTAKSGGLRVEDVIIEVNHHPILQADEVTTLASITREDATLALVVLRNHTPVHLNVKLGKSPPPPPMQYRDIFQGITMKDYHQMEPDGRIANGVEIVSVAAGTKAWLLGLSAHDVIMAINHKPTYNLKSMKKQIDTSTQNPILLTLNRQHNRLFMAMDIR